jgi:Peptidase A4 family
MSRPAGGRIILGPGGSSRMVRNYQMVTSNNWSGYAQHTFKQGTFSAIEDTWTVPLVNTSKPRKQYSSDWVGIGGYNESTLVQAGTSEWNDNGTAKYDAWTEVLPDSAVTITGLAIRPGDEVLTVVEETAVNTWKMTVKNLTTGRSGGDTVRYRSSGKSAEAILERPHVNAGIARLATTGNVTFDPGSFSTAGPGTPVWQPLLTTIPQAKLAEIVMMNTKGTVTLATPSVPSSDLEGFSVADGATAPPPPG